MDTDDRSRSHRRCFQIAGITIAVESDRAFTENSFDPKFEAFRVDAPGDDVVLLRHHFDLPPPDEAGLGREVYRKPPWVIYRGNRSWTYKKIPPHTDGSSPQLTASFNDDHTQGRIFHPNHLPLRFGNLETLSSMVTDQIFLAPVLADRQACLIHSAGAVLDGQGLLFVGHSEAGKSTTVKMLGGRAEILCDDRNIVRRWPEGFRIHGTWSHGEVPLVSPASAPLRAVLFLHKAGENRLLPLRDRKSILGGLFACLIRSFPTKDWMDKTLAVIERITVEVPCFDLRFDKSGEIVGLLEDLTGR